MPNTRMAFQSTRNARMAFRGVAILFKDILMPKIKTHKGAAKRFKFTGKGKIRRNRALCWTLVPLKVSETEA